MNLEEKARALAELYLAHTIKGHPTCAYYDDKGLDINAVKVPLNRGDRGLCEYIIDKQQVFDLDNPQQKVITTQTVDGFTHVFYGEPTVDEDDYWYFIPFVFLGEIAN